MVGSKERHGLSPADEMRLRRLAMQLVSQLPHDIGQAHAALEFAREFVDEFLTPTSAAKVPIPFVVRP